jgi:hypothetical protein
VRVQYFIETPSAASILPVFHSCCRDFRAKNPAVAQFDKYLAGQVDPRSVGQLFAAKQLEYMRADKSEEEAYQHARIWLLENGQEMLERMGIEIDDPDPEARRRLLFAHQEALRKQAERLQAALSKLSTGDPDMPMATQRAVSSRSMLSKDEYKLSVSAGVEPPTFVSQPKI